MNDIETPQSISSLPPKQQAYALLRQNDVNIDEAAKSLEYSKKYAYNLESKLKKYDLTDNKLVSKANRAIKKLVDGKPFGSIEKVKDSTSLAAAQMIYDRYQPAIKQSMNVNTNISFVKVDTNEFK